MPTESILTFLDRAKSHQILAPEQIEQLFQEADTPQAGMEHLCRYLLERKILTPYQAQMLLEGHGDQLNIGGYPVADSLGPSLCGRAYKVYHPQLRIPLILRRITAEDLAPDDNLEAYWQRLSRLGQLEHPHIQPVLDYQRLDDAIIVLLDPMSDWADLQTLSEEIGGPMPANIGLQVAVGLASALTRIHHQDGIHGDIRPCHIVMGPLVESKAPDGGKRRRPAAHATVRLAETGLVPHRSPGSTPQNDPAQAAYIPPEVLSGSAHTAAGDIYQLGLTLYYLLTNQYPKPPESQAAPSPADKPRKSRLQRLRPDLPVEFVECIERMLSPSPEERPTATAIVQKLDSLLPRKDTATLAEPPWIQSTPGEGTESLPTAVPVTMTDHSVNLQQWQGGSGTTPHEPSSGPTRPQRRTALSDAERSRGRLLMILGGILHLTAVILLLAWAFGAFSSRPEPDPTPAPKKDNEKKYKRYFPTPG